MSFFKQEIEKDGEIKKDCTKKNKNFNFLDTLDIEEIKKIHEETELMKQKKSVAVLNGLNMNPIQIHGREIHSEDRLLNKFKYAFKRAKKNM
mmetsp:Transcript_2017/g.1816  ORF Transcript_2017/g.1816 Transcript_2017/m.1816 type:complete len:92 (+) Transcript_2017:604-879(+)